MTGRFTRAILRAAPAAALASLAAIPALPAAARAQATPPQAARTDDATPIPFDTAVTVGRLPNGLRYYIRANHKPEKRAELRLAVNVGSVLEDPDQRGLAHMVEHMAFNGTTHFRKNELVSYLESIGMRFGADLNAYTSFDETVYQLQVPTDSGSALEKGIQILDDWASGQLFEHAEIDKERGVVIEEWRMRSGAGLRMAQQQLPVLLRGTPYPDRIPIGGQKELQTFADSSLVRFYKTWYRPDLMAVIVVGDFDKKRVEQLIRTAFADQKNPTKERPRPSFAVADHDSTLVAITTDPEATTTSVELTYKQPLRPERTLGDYRRGLVEQLYDYMLGERFDEMRQKPDAPFVQAYSNHGRLFGTRAPKESYELGALVREGGAERGLEALLTEAERVDRYGFTQGELDRARTTFLRDVERAYAERERTESARYADQYVDSFLNDEPSPGVARDLELERRYLPGIQLAEVNASVREAITDRNRVVVVSTPEKADAKLPTPAQLLAVFDAVKRKPITAYTEAVSDAPLVATMPTPGKVVATSEIREAGITQWTLSNGVRVLLKPTDFKADQILFQATSPGGLSLLSDADYRHTFIAAGAVQQGGVGTFNLIDLNKRLTGKVARVSPTLGDLDEGMSGSASPKDVETMFQLINLYFTQPRMDSAAFEAWRGNLKAVFANRSRAPEAAFQDTLSQTMSQHHPRSPLLTTALLDSFDLKRSFEVYRDRFADASDFTFAFVGNFNVDSIRPLVERYLGSLPATHRKETWRDNGIRPPAGAVEKAVRKGVAPKSTTALIFTAPAPYTPQNRHALGALTQLLDSRLRDQLREEMGGTYSISINGGISWAPRQEATTQIVFPSDPVRADTLVRAIFRQIDSIQRVPPSAAEVAKVKEIERRGRETAVKDNGYWLTSIVNRVRSGEDLRGIVTYDQLIEGLTAEQLTAAAKQFLDPKHYVRVTLYPESSPLATP